MIRNKNQLPFPIWIYYPSIEYEESQPVLGGDKALQNSTSDKKTNRRHYGEEQVMRKSDHPNTE